MWMVCAGGNTVDVWGAEAVLGDKCKTRYPILLVHGAAFRDYKRFFNYWGRIPGALRSEGALVYYGEQDSWGSLEHNANMLKGSINKILALTSCEKLNVLAHSKGGLELRYCISTLGMADKIASLTTISTPHRGSETMDRLYRLPKPLFKMAAGLVNPWCRMLGDESPDFHEAARQLTASYAKQFNERNPDSSEVYYQSYAAAMKNPLSDLLTFLPHIVVSRFEGENDGLVSVESAKWGEFKGVLRGISYRGVSHADVIDLRRADLSRKTGDGVSDIRTVYVEIVSSLKAKGL